MAMDMILTDTARAALDPDSARRQCKLDLRDQAWVLSEEVRPTFLRHNGQLGVGRLTGPLTTIEGVDLRHVPKPTRLAGTTAIPPLSRLFMIGMGMLCRHVVVRDHGNDQHSICY